MLSPPEKSLMSYEGIEVPRGGPASIWPQAPDDKDDQWKMLKTAMFIWVTNVGLNFIWECMNSVSMMNYLYEFGEHD